MILVQVFLGYGECMRNLDGVDLDLDPQPNPRIGLTIQQNLYAPVPTRRRAS